MQTEKSGISVKVFIYSADYYPEKTFVTDERILCVRIVRRRISFNFGTLWTAMEKMVWEPEYTVGQEFLDEEHKVLIGMINALIEDPKAEYGSEVVSDLLAEGTRYAVKHFKSEEEYMESIGYPGLATHRQEHKQFLVKMTNVSMKVIQKKKGPTDLLAFLKTWLMHHILYTDMKYKKFRDQIFSKDEAQ